MTQIEATVAELAYAAGFIDGEGCIHISERSAYWQHLGKKTRYTGFFGAVKVSQNVKEPLEMLQRLFGGNVRLRDHPGKDNRRWNHYEWEAPRSVVADTLEAILPYLIVKHCEAELAIPFFRSLAGGFHSGRRLTDEIREQRRSLIRGVKEAKSNGRSVTEEAA